MKIKVKSCVTCHWRQYLGTKLAPYCLITVKVGTPVLIMSESGEDFPDWCPLNKEPVTVEKA